MDFTERPKQVVEILTGTLDLENFGDVTLLGYLLHQLVD